MTRNEKHNYKIVIFVSAIGDATRPIEPFSGDEKKGNGIPTSRFFQKNGGGVDKEGGALKALYPATTDARPARRHR